MLIPCLILRLFVVMITACSRQKNSSNIAEDYFEYVVSRQADSLFVLADFDP